jgi:hypothetical protein
MVASEAWSDQSEYENQIARKKHKGGIGMGWLSKAILPHLQGKSKRSAVVAPAPEYDSLADSELPEKATDFTLAWQASTPTCAEIHGPCGNDSPHAPRAGSELPAVSAALAQKSENPLPSPIALAQSLRLSEALSSATGDSAEANFQANPMMTEAPSHDSNAALPIELIDGSMVPDMGGLRIEIILPPLPNVAARKLNAEEDIPGCAVEILDLPAAIVESLKSPTDDDCMASIQLSKSRPRPVSFRGLARQCTNEARVSEDPFVPRKGIASGQTAVSGAAGTSSLPCRPTSTEDETAANFPTSRQSARSFAWMEEWTPGGMTPHQTVGQQPLPPPLPAPGAMSNSQSIASTASTLTAQPSEEPTPSPAMQDPSAVALKRASERASLQWATAPANKRRWSKLIDDKATEEPIDASLTEVTESPSKSRPVSRELQQRAREQVNFSELAMSFASLDEGT